MSIALATADAVTAKLNALDLGATATRRILPRKSADQIRVAVIDVLPASQTREVETRSVINKAQTVVIVVSRTIDFDDEDDVNATQAEAVIALAESIADSLLLIEHRQLPLDGGGIGYVIAVQVGGDSNPILDQDLLDQHNLARCLIEVQLRVN